MRVWLICFPLLALVAGPLGIMLGGAPRADRPMLVVVGPWEDPAGLVRSAGGWPIGPATAPMAVFAASDDITFASRARENGAWFVIDGSALAALCGVV